ncbi:hemolysin family protein [Rhodococcus xishaensis]|uniref:HlyC/CorC family transporter n=1 Tax=Rhodococcus xishaensis TaxID=2487364 RepID=A0A438AUA3_9NOCA|nr:hemolysin family protein [Rhodococcus xishaensis]RVW02182.1 HlyC/CorC family transporter [Rhodococcus xishaensis]
MTGDTLLDFVLVVAFILAGGVFAATEIALVSLREGQIHTLAHRSRRGARAASLARNPNRFLSSVQIGVTVAGFFSAAYGAASLAPSIAPTLRGWGMSVGAADVVALVSTTLVISYLSLVLGELVPKRIALQNATGVALVTAPSLDRFATLVRPVIWLLSVSTNGLVRLLGVDPSRKREEMTPAELRELVLGQRGIEDEERRVLAEVFDVGQRTLNEVMRPRTEVDFLAEDTPVRKAQDETLAMGHSRFPVVGTSRDDVVGFVHVRDLQLADPARVATVGELCRPILALPGSKPALAALALMRRDSAQILLVVDEYGGTAGIATLEDIVEEVVGEIGDEFAPLHEPDAVDEDGQEQEIDGLLLVEDFEKDTGTTVPDGPYETIAGYVLHRLQRIPRLGDVVDVDGHRLTVSEMDGRRIAALHLSKDGPGERPQAHWPI